MDFHWIRGSLISGEGWEFDKATPRPRNPIELRPKSKTEGGEEILGVSIRGVDFPLNSKRKEQQKSLRFG